MCCASLGVVYDSSDEHCHIYSTRPPVKLMFIYCLLSISHVTTIRGENVPHKRYDSAKTDDNSPFNSIPSENGDWSVELSPTDICTHLRNGKLLIRFKSSNAWNDISCGKVRTLRAPKFQNVIEYIASEETIPPNLCFSRSICLLSAANQTSSLLESSIVCVTSNNSVTSNAELLFNWHISLDSQSTFVTNCSQPCKTPPTSLRLLLRLCDRDVKLHALKSKREYQHVVRFFPSAEGKTKREISKRLPASNQSFVNNTGQVVGTLGRLNHSTAAMESNLPSLRLPVPRDPGMQLSALQGHQNVIYIHGLFESSGGGCRTQSEAGPYEILAAKLAIQHINDREIITGYQLDMYYNDTKCDSGVAVDSFFYCLYRMPTMMMMLGTGSSEVTERLARVVSRWNVIQVSYGAFSPVLSDRKNFPFFFRTVAPDSSHNAALLAFIQYHRWDTVATLHEQGDNHALPMTKLVTELEQANISVSLTKGVSERDYKEHLQELKAQDCRILIGSFSLPLVRKIFCHVYKLEMYGSDYAWILQGDLKEPWWNDPRGTECSKGELAKASFGAIVVGSHYGLDGNSTSVSGKTIEDILNAIGFNTDARNSGFVSQTYDAVWAMALALSKVQEQWMSEQRNLSFRDFSYAEYEMAEDIATVLGKLRFVGVSGPVSFHNSDRVGITSFHQNQGEDKELSLVCLHYPHSDELHFDCAECIDIQWQGSRVPIARRIIILRVAVLDRGVLICVTSLAAFGVVLALLFLSFNLYFRRFKFIKLSSPNLNNFVVVGCILVYVAMILLGMDHGSLASETHFGIICTARAFLLSGGFSLAFGCMFIKTYRVYHIFIRSNSGIVKSKLLHDKQLLGMVSVLVMVDCFLVTLWVTLDPMERQLRNLTMQVNPLERNVVYLYQREQCYSAHMVKWLGSLYIYKGLLLVVGCYMAWETRHVKIPALNDSQYIGMSVYNVVITSVIVVALANVIPVERYTLTFVLVSALIFVSTTMTLCLLFLPKIHTILTGADDGGAVVATPGVKVEFRTRRFALDEPRESMYRAEVLNRALKRELIELEEELARLSEKMGVVPPDLHKSKMRSTLETKQQDEDSDDDLPPWLDDYKKYPANGSGGVWYTRAGEPPGACFSVLSAVHPLLVSTADAPSQLLEPSRAASPEQICEATMQEDASANASKTCIDLMRSSLPTMMLFDSRQKATGSSLGTGLMSLSDRALNKIKHPKKPAQQTVPIISLNKMHSGAILKPKQYSKSTTRLSNGSVGSDVQGYAYRTTGSLPKISASDRCCSTISGNTVSCGSEWTTAPQYSSSFATAPEGSSSNNRTLVTPCETPEHHQVLPRDSLTDSSNGLFLSDDSYSNNGKLGEKKNSSARRSDSVSSMGEDPFAQSNVGDLTPTCDEFKFVESAHELKVRDKSHESPDILGSSFSNHEPKKAVFMKVAMATVNADEKSMSLSCEESDTNVTDLSSPSSSLEFSECTSCHNGKDTTLCRSEPEDSEISSKSSKSITKNVVFADESAVDSETTDLLCESSIILMEPILFTSNNVTPSVDRSELPCVEGAIDDSRIGRSFNNANMLPSRSMGRTHIGGNESQVTSQSKNNTEESDDAGHHSTGDNDLNISVFAHPQENSHLPQNNPSRDNDQTQYENLRHIFQIERDLILLELDKSEAIDL